MPTQTQTADGGGIDVYYLDFGDEDDEERHLQLAELRAKISHDDDYAPTQDDFEHLWEFQGHDPEATLNNVFARWNAGSRQESEAFARRVCEDCGMVFDGVRDFSDRGERPSGARPENPVSLSVRQAAAKAHEDETGHTVGHGHRSMSVGDIVVVDGVAHLIRSFSIDPLPHIEVDG